MKKLTLDLETLAVDSFRPEAAPADARGTVRGFDWTVPSYPYYCYPAPETSVGCA